MLILSGILTESLPHTNNKGTRTNSDEVNQRSVYANHKPYQERSQKVLSQSSGTLLHMLSCSLYVTDDINIIVLSCSNLQV